MLAEHEQGRVYIRNMSQAVVDYEVGNAEATALLVKYITDYIELLEQHISKENTMLFSMADKLLSAEMQEKLFDRFETLKSPGDANSICSCLLYTSPSPRDRG